MPSFRDFLSGVPLNQQWEGPVNFVRKATENEAGMHIYPFTETR